MLSPVMWSARSRTRIVALHDQDRGDDRRAAEQLYRCQPLAEDGECGGDARHRLNVPEHSGLQGADPRDAGKVRRRETALQRRDSEETHPAGRVGGQRERAV